MGIHVVSAQPSILFNKISKSLENGVLCEAKKEIRCDTLLQFNTIEKNNLNGILFTGLNNFSKCDQNLAIRDNSLAGVRVEESASVSVVNNTI